MPEGRLEVQCGPEGTWTPDPTLHTCRNASMEEMVGQGETTAYNKVACQAS